MSKRDKNDKQIHHLLVVSAIKAELIELQNSLKKLPNLTIGSKQLNIQTKMCGVGNIESALFLSNYLNKNEVDEIIFIGSAGAYNPNADLVGKNCLSSNFHQLDTSVLLGKSKIPEIMLSKISSELGLVANVCRDTYLFEMGLDVNSTNSITLFELTKDICDSNYYASVQLENLETFGLAVVAKKKLLPLTSLLAITNMVNIDGSKEWLKNYKEMGRQLNIDFLNVLKSL